MTSRVLGCSMRAAAERSRACRHRALLPPLSPALLLLDRACLPTLPRHRAIQQQDPIMQPLFSRSAEATRWRRVRAGFACLHRSIATPQLIRRASEICPMQY